MQVVGKTTPPESLHCPSKEPQVQEALPHCLLSGSMLPLDPAALPTTATTSQPAAPEPLPMLSHTISLSPQLRYLVISGSSMQKQNY